MENDPQKRPSKAENLKRKKLATARRKKKQRQLMFCAIAVIAVIVVVAVICVALVWNKSKNPTPVEKETEKVTATQKEEDTTTSQKKEDTTTKETTTAETTAEETTTTEKEEQDGGNKTSPIFTYTADGKVSANPMSYTGLRISIAGNGADASTYYTGYADYVKKWYDAVKGSASLNFTTGEGEYWFHLIFDGVDANTRLGLRVNGSRISYGAVSGMPNNIGAVDFSVAGISLGNSSETVTSALGTPTAKTDNVLTYDFESGATLYFRLSGGKVSQIYLTLVPFEESN